MKINQKNIIIAIIAGLLLLNIFTGYVAVNKSNTLEQLEKNSAAQEMLIATQKGELIIQAKISDSLSNIVKSKESLVKIKEQQLNNIQAKYDKLKGKIKELTKEEDVIYLSERLKKTPGYVPSEFPKLFELNSIPVIIIDTNETKQINSSFVALDESTEKLDTALKLIFLKSELIENLYDLVESNNKEINICNNIVKGQDVLNNQKDSIIIIKDKTIKKLNNKNKIKSYIISILGGATAVLGILIII